VSGSDGSSDSITQTFQALTAAPLAAISGAPAMAQEGQAITLAGTVANPNISGPLTYNWAVTKNGNPFAVLPNDTTGFFTFTPTDEGSYQVTLTASDSQGRTATASPATVAVVEATPTLTITGGTTAATLGTPVTFTGSATSPGTTDTFTLS
jgi:hypothetical protein